MHVAFRADSCHLEFAYSAIRSTLRVIAGERDPDPVSPIRFPVCWTVRWHPDCSAKSHPPPPQPLRGRSVQFGPVRSVRTRNPMCPITFSPRHALGFLLSVRDKFGRDRQSEGAPKKLLCFFGFLPRSRCDSVTHNPLVPGSSPGGPTISHRIHQLMALRPRDRSPLM